MGEADYHDRRAAEERALAAEAAPTAREVHLALAGCHANAAWLLREEATVERPWTLAG